MSGEWVFCIAGGGCPYKHVKMCIFVFGESINEGVDMRLCVLSWDEALSALHICSCVTRVCTFMSESHMHMATSAWIVAGVCLACA